MTKLIIFGKQHSRLKNERVLTIYDYHEESPTQRWFSKRSFEDFTSGTTLNWLLTPEYKYLVLSPVLNCMNYITVCHKTCLGKCFRLYISVYLIHQIKKNQPNLNTVRSGTPKDETLFPSHGISGVMIAMKPSSFCFVHLWEIYWLIDY